MNVRYEAANYFLEDLLNEFMAMRTPPYTVDSSGNDTQLTDLRSKLDAINDRGETESMDVEDYVEALKKKMGMAVKTESVNTYHSILVEQANAYVSRMW